MDRVFIESRMYNQPVSILLIDVDKFKHFNDKYGHLCGDEILKYFSSTLRLSFDEVEHYPFRYGGDEFVIVFPKKTAKEVHFHANKFNKNIKKRHFLLKGRLFKMSFSGGIATFPSDADSMDKLLEKADKAMYFSKKHCQGTTTQYNKITARRFSEIAVAVMVILLALGLFFGREFIFKGKIRDLFKPFGKKGSMLVPAKAPAIQLKEEELDTIYLKSGGTLKGIVSRQTPAETEIKLKMDQGEGLLIFKNSDIQSIEKGKR